MTSPYELIPVKIDIEDANKQVRSVCTTEMDDEDSITYIETQDGVLQVFSPCPDSSALDAFVLTQDRIVKKVVSKGPGSNKSAVVGRWECYISILDTGQIGIYPLDRIDPSDCHLLTETKHIIAFSVHERARTLCAISKDASLAAYSVSSTGRFQYQATFTLIKPGLDVVCLNGQVAYIKHEKQFSLMELQTGRSIHVAPEFTHEKSAGAVVVRVPSSREDLLFVALETRGALLTQGGTHIPYKRWELQPTRSVEWKSPPKKMLFHSPFILCLYADRVEIRFVYTLELCDMISMKNIVSGSIGITSNDMKVVTKNCWLLLRDGTLSNLRREPLDMFVSKLDKKGMYEQVVAVYDSYVGPEVLPDTELKQWRLRVAYNYFRQGQFRSAALHFLAINDFPQLRFIALYPNEILPVQRSDQVEKKLKEFAFMSVQLNMKSENLMNAVSVLVEFLNFYRHSNSKSTEDPDKISECVDTALLKASVMLENDTGLASVRHLVDSNNACILTECEMFLRAHQQWPPLLRLYNNRKLHRKTLELLEELHDIEALEDEGSTLYRDQMISYLQRLGQPQISLFYEFSKRILNEDPRRGLEIFTGQIEIGPQQLLPFLKSCTVSNAEKVEDEATEFALIDGISVAIEYLTQQVYHNSSCPPSIHDELVYLLLDAIATDSDPVTLCRVAEDKTRRGVLRRRLMSFLEWSTAYHPERMLSRTPPEMIEERSILLSKLKRHEQVLEVYIHQLGDMAMAEEYCDRCFSTGVTGSEIYTTLLKIYLQERSEDENLLEPALQLMRKHFDRISVQVALDLLSPSVPIAQLQPYLTSVIEHRLDQMRNTTVAKHLSNIEFLQVQDQLYREQSRMVRFSVNQKCSLCRKSVNNESFLCLPDGSITHYACGKSVL